MNQVQDEVTPLETEKRRLECEKLRAEIEQISIAWWKRPGYIGGMAPIIIALVGFASAWATGYFNTQREVLASSIAQLETEQERLQEKTEALEATYRETQNKLDHAYISLKLAIGDAGYALNHLQGYESRLSEEQQTQVEEALTVVPENVASLIRDVLARDRLANDIVPITKEELENLQQRLESIPASDWAAKLEWIGPLPALRSPEGRFYNPEDGKYYDDVNDFWPK